MQLHNYGSLWKNEANEKKSANFKPAKIFISDVFPAPDGPRMAVSWPDLKAPLIWCKILLAFFPRRAVHDYVTIKTLSDWLHLKLSIGDDLLSKYCFKVILFLVSRKKKYFNYNMWLATSFSRLECYWRCYMPEAEKVCGPLTFPYGVGNIAEGEIHWRTSLVLPGWRCCLVPSVQLFFDVHSSLCTTLIE